MIGGASQAGKLMIAFVTILRSESNHNFRCWHPVSLLHFLFFPSRCGSKIIIYCHFRADSLPRLVFECHC